jgi:hypothetical protein
MEECMLTFFVADPGSEGQDHADDRKEGVYFYGWLGHVVALPCIGVLAYRRYMYCCW